MKVQICEVSISIFELRNLGSLGILIALVSHGRFLRVCKCESHGQSPIKGILEE